MAIKFDKILGCLREEDAGSGGGGDYTPPRTFAYGYQDFEAGEITTTSVTLTAQENGTSSFDADNIINATAVILTADKATPAYSGAFQLFSTKIAVASQAGANITLNAVPHVDWGTIRVWYLYKFTTGLPVNYTRPPFTINDDIVTELGALFVDEEEAENFVHKTGNETIAGEKNFTNNIGVNNDTPFYPIHVLSDADDHETNFIAIGGTSDKTRGFSVENQNGYKWSQYVYADEDGDIYYFANGNSERDVLIMQSNGRVGLNIPTTVTNIEILKIVQTGSNTYATVTCEIPHRLANNTMITIEGASTAKFNGSFTISNQTTMTFRINGLEVGAVSEEPTDAQVVIPVNIPAALAVFPQWFDFIFSFDKALDTGIGTGYTNLTGNMRTSFGTPDIIVPTTTGSCLLLGKKSQWRTTNLDISVASNGSSAMVVEYSNTSDGWTQLSASTTSGNSLVDTTNRLRQDGIINWDLKSFKPLWGKRAIQTDPSHSTEELYWIRISLTGTITTAPQSKSIGNHGTDRIAVYAQSGDVTPAFAVDQVGRLGLLPPELETKYSMGALPGLTTSKFELISEDGYRSDFTYYLANSNIAQLPAICMARSGGTVTTKTACTNGMDIGALYAYAWDGATFSEVGKILFEHVGTATSGTAASRIGFYTKNTTGSNTERARITEAGLFGIGTTVPQKQLDINSATGECLQLTYNDNNGSAANKVTLDVTSTGDLTITPSGGDASVLGNITATNLSGTNTGDNAVNSSCPTISSGTTAPSSTPSKIGDIFVDTTLNQMYIANGSSSSANWIKVDSDNNLTNALKSNYDTAYTDALASRQSLDCIYDGVDLSVKFASEIAASPYDGDVWAWIKARTQDANFTGIHVGDYIPVSMSAGSAGGYTLSAQTFNAQIAGIDTYWGYGDTAIVHHIDFITKTCMDTAIQWQPNDNSNGTANQANPWLTSKLYAVLNGVNNFSTNAYNSVAHGVDASAGGILQLLPTALQNAIIQKRQLLESRYSASGLLYSSNSWAWANMGKLWVPNEFEVYGSQVWSHVYTNGNAVQYPLFAGAAGYKGRLKTNSGGSRVHWWLAVTSPGNSTSACLVYSSGHAGIFSCSGGICVPLCFRIG